LISPKDVLRGRDVLVYYRFFGRIVGKALRDGQLRLLQGYGMLPYIYKHMLGWPVSFRDVESIDPEHYKTLKHMQKLYDSGETLSKLSRRFPTTGPEATTSETSVRKKGKQNEQGVKSEAKIRLITNENLTDYLETCMQYQVMGRVKGPLKELLLGIFEVIPEPLLSIFDFQELEFLLCGLPVIDMEDWKAHTEYTGEFLNSNGDNPACRWFWEVVEEDFDQVTKGRLLQFVSWQGSAGNSSPFTIRGVPVGLFPYPRVQHECSGYRSMDLPLYKTKEELRHRLKEAVTAAATGFDIRVLADIRDLGVLFHHVRANPTMCRQ
jgi:hypothetical protein